MLVSLLRPDQPAVQVKAASCLGNLAAGSHQNKDAIIVAGAVPLLVALSRSKQPNLQTTASKALRRLNVTRMRFRSVLHCIHLNVDLHLTWSETARVQIQHQS